MTLKTIECRLYAPPDTLRHLWQLMAEKNTPLINELLHGVSQHPDFETWLKQKTLPQQPIKSLCNELKAEAAYQSQPGRFYSSAIALTHYIYKSWLAVQQKLQQRIEGKERWLALLKSDRELELECGQSIDDICQKATDILKTLATEVASVPKQKTGKSKKKSRSPKDQTRFEQVFQAYYAATEPLTRCALAYLLKNQCQVPEIDEDAAEYALRRQKKEIEIERLRQQLQSRLPKGRDLTGEEWFNTLATVGDRIPQDVNEAASWQAKLLTKSPVVPFPVAYESNTDLTWSKDERGHLLVKFNGLGKYYFEIRCDRQQLPWFRRFHEDQEIKKNSDNQHSSALFSLRSARLLWREGKGKGNPWEVHKLYLQCSLDTRFWTTEGTAQIAEEKSNAVKETLNRLQTKETLNKQQQTYQKRQESVLNNINTPFPRPHKSLYQGDSAIVVGVRLGLEKPATLAVVNAATNEVLAYRSIKQLLGKNNYHLLNRQRQQKQRLSHLRHKAQKREADNQFGESNLGQHIDRLIAKAIVEIAQTYQAGSIVVPKLKQIREIMTSEIQAKAQQKIPGHKTGQKKYAKQYQINVHQWSYGRLIDSIQHAASKVGIPLESAYQLRQGTIQEQAKNLAIAAYTSRLEKIQ